METQKTLNSQSSVERKMELEESIFLASGYTTKLQSSRQYDTGTKTEIQTNGTRQKAQKTASSINGAQKTGQLHVKE